MRVRDDCKYFTVVKSFRRNKGSITGEIYAKTTTNYFPRKEWSIARFYAYSTKAQNKYC